MEKPQWPTNFKLNTALLIQIMMNIHIWNFEQFHINDWGVEHKALYLYISEIQNKK
jgi:hypothetical protein